MTEKRTEIVVVDWCGKDIYACVTCGSGYAEYINGCPHCWEAGLRSKVVRTEGVDGPGKWQ